MRYFSGLNGLGIDNQALQRSGWLILMTFERDFFTCLPVLPFLLGRSFFRSVGSPSGLVALQSRSLATGDPLQLVHQENILRSLVMVSGMRGAAG